MARSGVDYSQVCNAAASLAQSGKQVTVDNVRAQLGGTGSKSTIAPLLKRWKAENAAQSAQASAALPADLAEAVKRLHESMQLAFTEQLERERTAWHVGMAESTATITELERQFAAVDAQRVALSSDLAAANAALSLQHSELDIERNAHRELQLINASLEQRLRERVSEIGSLREHLIQGRHQFEHFQVASQARWENERRLAERREAELASANRSLNEQLTKEHADSALARGKLEQFGSEYARLQTAFETLREHSADQRALTDKLSEKLERCSEAGEQLQLTHDELVQRMAHVKTELAVVRGETVALRAQLTSAEQQINALLADKMTLIRQHTEAQVELRYCKDLLEKSRLP